MIIFPSRLLEYKREHDSVGLKFKTGKSIEELVFAPAGGVTVPPSAQIYQTKPRPQRKIVLLFSRLDIKEKETV